MGLLSAWARTVPRAQARRRSHYWSIAARNRTRRCKTRGHTASGRRCWYNTELGLYMGFLVAAEWYRFLQSRGCCRQHSQRTADHCSRLRPCRIRKHTVQGHCTARRCLPVDHRFPCYNIALPDRMPMRSRSRPRSGQIRTAPLACSGSRWVPVAGKHRPNSLLAEARCHTALPAGNSQCCNKHCSRSYQTHIVYLPCKQLRSDGVVSHGHATPERNYSKTPLRQCPE